MWRSCLVLLYETIHRSKLIGAKTILCFLFCFMKRLTAGPARQPREVRRGRPRVVEPPEGHHGSQSVRGGESAGVGYGPRVQVGGKEDASCPCATITATTKSGARGPYRLAGRVISYILAERSARYTSVLFDILRHLLCVLHASWCFFASRRRRSFSSVSA